MIEDQFRNAGRAIDDDKAFIYQAEIYCSECAEQIKARLMSPENPEDEGSFDSDDYPKGPYPDGGGEADSFQHCGGCGIFLRNPLTTDGIKYVIELIGEWVGSPNDYQTPSLDLWVEELESYSLEVDQQAVVDRYKELRR